MDKCPVCGAPVPPGMNRCSNCNNQLGSMAQPSRPSAGQPRPACQPGNPAPGYSQPPAHPPYQSTPGRPWAPAYSLPWVSVPTPREKAKEKPKGAPPLSVRQCLLSLFGLVPLLGLIYSLLLSFGSNVEPQKKNLGRAMLWVHGAAVLVLLVGLGIWVIQLAVELG